MPLLEMALEVGLVSKAQLVCHICQTRALLEQYLGPVQALVDLEGMGCLSKGLLELAYQLVATPATGLRKLVQRQIAFHLCTDQPAHCGQGLLIRAGLGGGRTGHQRVLCNKREQPFVHLQCFRTALTRASAIRLSAL